MFSIPYGILQFFANILGQIGLVTIEAGKSAFLTSLYVVFTPLLQALVLDNSVSKLTKWTWISAAVSVVGSFCLAGLSSDFAVSFGTGEILTIIAAAFWACEIVIADIGSKFIDGVDLALSSSCVSTAISLVAAFVMERDTMVDLIDLLPLYGLKLIIWVSLLETVASVLDTIGQAYTTGYQAAVIMGLDGVVTVIFGYVYLSETLGNIEKLGCVLLLAATYLASIEETVMQNEEGIEEHTFKLSTNMHDRRLAMGGWPHMLLRSHTIDTEYRRRPRYYSNLEMSSSISSRAAAQFTAESGVKLKRYHSFQAGDAARVSFAELEPTESSVGPRTVLDPMPSKIVANAVENTDLRGSEITTSPLPSLPVTRSRENLSSLRISAPPKNQDSASLVAERYLKSYGSTQNK
jgi:drug/metabolite transporter (DMT)-like permease